MSDAEMSDAKNFAVIFCGGKQYNVRKDDTLVLDFLLGEVGKVVVFSDVMLVGGSGTAIGTPFIKGACVRARVLAQGKGAKILSLKMRRRQNSRRRRGHRQPQTQLKILDIVPKKSFMEQAHGS